MSTPGRDAGRRSARPRSAMSSPRWSVVLVIVVLGGAVGYGVFRWLDALAVPVAVPGGRPQVDTLEVIRTTLAVLAFIGALLIGLYLYGTRRSVQGDVVHNRGDAVRGESDVVRNDGDVVRNQGDVVRNESDVVRDEGDVA